MDGSWGPENGNAWGGLVILGNAPLNSDREKNSWAPGITIEDTVEGIPTELPEDSRVFGGRIQPTAQVFSAMFPFVLGVPLYKTMPRSMA